MTLREVVATYFGIGVLLLGTAGIAGLIYLLARLANRIFNSGDWKSLSNGVKCYAYVEVAMVLACVGILLWSLIIAGHMTASKLGWLP